MTTVLSLLQRKILKASSGHDLSNPYSKAMFSYTSRLSPTKNSILSAINLLLLFKP